MNEIYIDSPIGVVQISLSGTKIVKTGFVLDKTQLPSKEVFNYNTTYSKKIATQFAEYFAGSRQNFTLDFSIDSGTEFQTLVWQEMLKIPYGQTRTYGQIAAKIGNPKAARAVGMACNKNPIGIVIPCHRIIGGNGKLTGYAGGLQKKQWLLHLENAF